MKAPCTKCGKMFERATKYCKICDKCWTDSRKVGPKKPFHALKTCSICCENIKTDEPRIQIQKRSASRKTYSHGNKMNSMGTYHAACWDNYIMPKIEKLLVKDKVKAWLNNLKPLEVVAK